MSGTPADQRRPVWLLVLAAAISAVLGGVGFIVSADPVTAGIVFAVAFIVSLVVIAMVVLARHPDSAELLDIGEQDREDAAD